MPLKLKPGQPLEFVLDCDKDDPIETRVVFLAKSLTAGESIDLVERLKNTPLEYQSLYEAWIDELFGLLTGWQNMPVEFSKEAIKAELSSNEIIELIRKIQHGQKMEAEEKKS